MLLYVCYVLVSSQLLGTSQKYSVPRMFIIISTDITFPTRGIDEYTYAQIHARINISLIFETTISFYHQYVSLL